MSDLKFYSIKTTAMKTYRSILIQLFHRIFNDSISANLDLRVTERRVFLYILHGLYLSITSSIKFQRQMLSSVIENEDEHSLKLWSSMTEFNFIYFNPKGVDWVKLRHISPDNALYLNDPSLVDMNDLEGEYHSKWNSNPPRRNQHWRNLILSDVFKDLTNIFLAKQVAEEIFNEFKRNIISSIPKLCLRNGDDRPLDLTMEQFNIKVPHTKVIKPTSYHSQYRNLETFFVFHFPSWVYNVYGKIKKN